MRVLVATTLVLTLCSVLAKEETSFVFSPTRYSMCSSNFESAADLELDACKAACAQRRGCEEFSYPLEGATSGCRLANAGGCQAKPVSNEIYAVFKKTVVQDEDPDYEGPGSRRRRRTTSRRRTHQAEQTSVSAEINQLEAQMKEQQEENAKAAKAKQEALQEAVLYVKERDAKKKVEARQLDMNVKKATLKGSLQAEGSEATSAVAAAEERLMAIKSSINKLRTQQVIFSVSKRENDKALEVSESEKGVVFNQILDARDAVENLMQDPGKLADQDRKIAEAILGKLRVAAALIRGDLPGLQEHQRSVDWIVNLRDAVKKAIRNPSPHNMEVAQEAYATAAKFHSVEDSKEEAKTEAEAADLQQKADESREFAQQQAAADEAKKKIAEEQAKLKTAEKLEEATKAAMAKNPEAIAPPQVTVTPVKPDVPKVTVKKMIRGYFDPPPEDEQL